MSQRGMRFGGWVRAIAIATLLANLQLDISPVFAQETPPTEDLRIVIIEGEGFTNNIKKHTAREPIVEVRDRNNSPVPGAVVIFTLPNSGASGTFANGGRLVSVVTNQTGRASTVFRPNSVAGSFKMNVTASANGHTATATLSQTNTAAVAGVSGATLGIIGAIAGAAAVTAVAVAKTTGGSGKSARVSIGPPSLP